MPTAAAMPLAHIVCVLVVAGVAATPDVTAGEPLTITAPQGPAAGEATLALDRPTRRLIQQGLRNEGFDPGTPDGLFGPQTRAAIREWQRSRGASPTGYLNGAEAELLRMATAPAVSESSPPPQASPAVEPHASSAAAPPSSTAEADANPAPPAAAEADPQNAAATNTEPTPRPASGPGNSQLPPDILADRHLVRTERLLANDDPIGALQAMKRDPRASRGARRRVGGRLRLPVRTSGLRGRTDGDGHRVVEPVPAGRRPRERILSTGARAARFRGSAVRGGGTSRTVAPGRGVSGVEV